MNHKPLFLAVTLIALLAVAGVFWYLQLRPVAVKQPVVQTLAREELTPAKTDEVQTVKDLIDGEYTFTPIDTSDWKTYRNEEVGFEAKIPKDWFCGGVALAPNLKTQHVCLEEKERKNYYDGKLAKQNLIKFNRREPEGDSLREYVDLEKKKGAKVYTVIVNGEIAVLTMDKYYTQVFDVSGRWMIAGFPAVDRTVFNAFVLSFKFLR